MPKVIICGYQTHEELQGLSPDVLLKSGPLWEKDVLYYQPWIDYVPSDHSQKVLQPMWKSTKCEGESTVIVCGQCTSSMDIASQLFRENIINFWDSVIAISQTSGRGRHKRNWFSPIGNIYASWILPKADESDEIDMLWQDQLSIVLGYIITQVFVENNIHTEIKWPNDLLLNNKKIAGLLIDMQPDFILAGIGINVESSPEDSLLKDDFSVSATSLKQEGYDITPLSLYMQIVQKGRSLFNQYKDRYSPEKFINLVNDRLAWKGSKVLLKKGREDIEPASLLGLAKGGGVELMVGGKKETYYSCSIIQA
jgi:BirA family biotin operon repressor/biotin-[acetyl-CoA-carboxylase] ligase